MTTDSTSSGPTPEQLAAANEQLQAQVNALREDFNAQVGAVTPEEKAQAQQALSEGVGSIGDKWWLLLVLGVITTIVGLVAVFSPSTALTWLAVLFGIWLVVSGIFQLVRAFGSGLDGGDRTLFLIAGALSIILGVLCFRSALGVVRDHAGPVAPADLAGRADDAEFDLEAVLARGDDGGDRILLAILGMDHRLNAFDGGLEGGAIDAEDPVGPVIPFDTTGGDVDLPRAHVAGAERDRPPFLAALTPNRCPHEIEIGYGAAVGFG